MIYFFYFEENNSRLWEVFCILCTFAALSKYKEKPIKMMLNFISKIKSGEYQYLILGHLSFFVLFIFAFIFANERVLFVDSGAQVFEFIRDEGFEIYVKRYSMYLFQMLPVLAVKLHLPVSVVIYSYSFSIPIIGYLLWLITVYYLKDQKIGLLMLFVMLGIRQTFFHAISETFQLMFFAAFLYAWLFQTRHYQSFIFSKILYYLLACIFIALCIFIHPVAIFFVGFILGLYVLDKQKTVFQKTIIVIMSVGLMLIKFLTVEQGSHDAQFIISIHECINRILHIFTLNIAQWYFERLIDFYWIPLFMFVVTLLFYWKRRKQLYFTFSLCFVIMFWFISVIIYANDGGDIALERSFLPLFFFCGLPFVTEVFPILSSKKNKLFLAGLTIFIGIGFAKIAVASIPYTKRLETIEAISAFANQQGKKKLLITVNVADQIFPDGNWRLSWGLGFESMMYSSLKGIDSTVNMYIVDSIDPKIEEYKNPEIYLAVPWWVCWKVDALNPHYFKLPQQPCSELVIEDGKMIIKDL
jgi:hypothetical protein